MPVCHLGDTRRKFADCHILAGSDIDMIQTGIMRHQENQGIGKIIYEENWGKRKLAYEINKTDVGIYVLWYFNAPKNKVASIEKDLRINEEVMRFMLLVAEDKKEAKPKAKKEVATEEVAKTEAKASKKVAPKETKAAEKERMKEIDEKLEKLLGDEEPKK